MSFKEWLNEGTGTLEKSLPKIKGWEIYADDDYMFTYSKTDSSTGITVDIDFEDTKSDGSFNGAKIMYNVQSDDPMERSALQSTTISRKLKDLKDVKNSVKFVLDMLKKKHKGLKTMKFIG